MYVHTSIAITKHTDLKKIQAAWNLELAIVIDLIKEYKPITPKVGPNAPPRAQEIRDLMKTKKDSSYKEWQRLQGQSKRGQACESKFEQAIHLMPILH